METRSKSAKSKLSSEESRKTESISIAYETDDKLINF